MDVPTETLQAFRNVLLYIGSKDGSAFLPGMDPTGAEIREKDVEHSFGALYDEQY